MRMKLRKKILSSFAAGSLAMLLSEGALRVFAPQPPSWIPLYGRHPSKPMFRVAPNLDRFADTGESRWHVFTDADGLRTGPAGRRASRDLPQSS